jgi:hypothetical protein
VSFGLSFEPLPGLSLAWVWSWLGGSGRASKKRLSSG